MAPEDVQHGYFRAYFARVAGKLVALSPPAGHVAWFDGWRGLCILAVLLGHFARSSLGPLAPFGVEMFFVLSGRLMAELLIVKRQPFPTFVFRRASRILPLLALYTGVTALGLGAAALVAGTHVNWLGVPAALLFFSNYLSEPVALLEHTWSLAVEEHSYLLLLLVAGVSARRPRVAGWIAAVLAAAMMLNGFRLFHGDPETEYRVFWRSDVRGASVLLSFALCLWLREREMPYLSWLSPVCLIAAVAWVLAYPLQTPVQMAVCTLLTVVSVNTLAFAAPAFRRLLSLRALTCLGTLSFSLYIWQQPFFMATHGGVPGVIAVPLAFACALWSYARVEAPARRALNARWSRERSRFAGPESARAC